MAAKKNNKYAQKWSEQIALDLADDLIAWLQVKPRFDDNGRLLSVNLYKKNFLLERGFDDATIDYLTKTYPKFSAQIKKIDQIQQANLIKFASTNAINPVFTMFVLKCNHDMIESDKKIDLDRKQAEFELKKQSMLKTIDTADIDIDTLKKEIRQLVADNGFH